MTSRENFTIQRECRRLRRCLVTPRIGCLCLLALATPAFEPLPGQDVEPSDSQEVSPYLAPRGYVCFRTEQSINIDGKIDESGWQDAPWTETTRTTCLKCGTSCR